MALSSVRRSVSARSSSWCSASSRADGLPPPAPARPARPGAAHAACDGLRRRGGLAPRAHQRELRLPARLLRRRLGRSRASRKAVLGVAQPVEPGAQLRRRAAADVGRGSRCAVSSSASSRRAALGHDAEAARPGAPAARAAGSRPHHRLVAALVVVRRAPGQRLSPARRPGARSRACSVPQRSRRPGPAPRGGPSSRGRVRLAPLEPRRVGGPARPARGGSMLELLDALLVEVAVGRPPPPSAGRAGRGPCRTPRRAGGRRWGSRPRARPSRCAGAAP